MRFPRAVLFLVCLCAAQAVLAQADAGSGVRIIAGQAVAVSHDFEVGPTLVRMSIAPGEERRVEIGITNREGEPATFALEPQDASAGEQGEPLRFYGAASGPYPARSWIASARRLSLRHGEQATVPVTVSVPRDAAPGDHYAALLATREGSGGKDAIAVVFLLQVAGTRTRSGAFIAVRPSSPLLLGYPVVFALSVRNDGDTALLPEGQIVIRNIAGDAVGSVPVRDRILLRGSSQNIRVDWRPAFAIGWYTAEARLQLWDGHVVTRRTSFLALPLLPAGAAVLLLAILLALWRSLRTSLVIRRRR